jgi:hypothetical protein
LVVEICRIRGGEIESFKKGIALPKWLARRPQRSQRMVLPGYPLCDLRDLCVRKVLRKDSTPHDKSVMNNGSDYDFIIIGSGAGGGILAYRVAPSGNKIFALPQP